MKKILCLILALIVVFGLIGCSSEPKIKDQYKDDEQLLETVFDFMDDFLNGTATANSTLEKLETVEDKISNDILKTSITTISINVGLYDSVAIAKDAGIDMGDRESELIQSIKDNVESLRSIAYK